MHSCKFAGSTHQSFLTTVKDDDRSAIDEPPFLDTDIGRATLVLTADDFAFFVTEHDLPHSLVLDAPKDTCYFALQFIEFGGDHLDQMMHVQPSTSAAASEIVTRSASMISNAFRIVYFINGASLFPSSADGGVSVNRDIFTTLLSRFRYLNSLTSSQPLHAMLTITRAPAVVLTPDQASAVIRDLADVAQIDPQLIQAPSHEWKGLGDLLWHALFSIGNLEKWSLTLGETVYVGEHLTPENTLNPDAIVQTLARMFRRDMIYSASDPTHFIAQHILSAFKEPRFRVTEQGDFNVWLDAESFCEYLEEAEVSEIPDVLMMQRFGDVVKSLAGYHLCIPHYGENHADLAVVLELPKDVIIATPSASSATEDHGIPDGAGGNRRLLVFAPKHEEGESEHVRFPYNTKLMDVIDSYFRKNVPAEIWLPRGTDSVFDETRDVTALQELRQARESILESLATQGRFSRGTPEEFHRLVWDLEELSLADALLSSSRSSISKQGTDEKRCLEIPSGVLRISSDVLGTWVSLGLLKVEEGEAASLYSSGRTVVHASLGSPPPRV